MIYKLKSEYAEEDILEVLSEILPEKKVASLMSRIKTDPCSNIHDCIVEVEVSVVDKQNFCWPELNPKDAELFKDFKKIKNP